MVYSRCEASDYHSVIASSLIKWFIYKSKDADTITERGYIIGEKKKHTCTKGDDSMATKSILKTVDINQKYLGRNLVEALDKSKKKKKYKRTPVNCEEMTKEKLKDMFG